MLKMVPRGPVRNNVHVLGTNYRRISWAQLGPQGSGHCPRPSAVDGNVPGALFVCPGLNQGPGQVPVDGAVVRELAMAMALVMPWPRHGPVLKRV